jgi:membrane protease YdiL (CAAX protease family)
MRALYWAFGLSWTLALLGHALGVRPGTPAYLVLGGAYMWIPGLVAFLFARKEGLFLPLSFRPNRFWLFAWLFPLALTLLSIPLSLPFAPWKGLAWVLPEGPPEGVLWAFALLQGLLAGATVNLLTALGEELLWRGYLWERLKGRGLWPASLEIGLYWGVWHAPLVLLYGHTYPEHRLPGMGMMVLFTLALTPALLYAREKGGSLWAPALLHGTLNAVAGLSLLAVERTHDLLVGAVGLPGLFLLSLFNLWLRGRV